MSGDLRTYPDIIQGTDEWLALRCGMVTASAVGQLITEEAPDATEFACPDCGAHPGGPCLSKARTKGDPAPIKTIHAARTDLAANSELPKRLVVAGGDPTRGLVGALAAERITGYVEPERMTADMWRGVEEEPFARKAYAEHHAPVEEMGFMVRDFGGGVRIGYSPDGLVGDEGLIEIKSRRQRTQVRTFLNGVVPAENMAQLQAGLLVTRRKWIDYVSFSGGMALFVLRVYPDPAWHAAIFAAAEYVETTCAEVVAAYEAATAGLPITERPQLEMNI